MEDTGNDFGLPTVEKEIKNSIKVAAAYLSRECHCHVDTTKFKELSDSLEISSTHIMGLQNIPSPLYDTNVTYKLKYFFLNNSKIISDQIQCVRRTSEVYFWKIAVYIPPCIILCSC